MAVRPGLSCATVFVLASPLVAACARDPLETSCPPLGVGDLVVSELRGPQTGTDGYGEWIELYDGSGGNIDLTGVRVTMTKLDGSASVTLLLAAAGDVAAPQVAADDFFVLGRFQPGDLPDHVDFGYADQFDHSLYDGAAVEVSACGQIIDRMIYRNALPGQGTYSFTGTIYPPDEAENDIENEWCPDTTADDATPTLGLRGTPGEKNRPCG